MQPSLGSRIDLGELKAHIVRKIGAEKSKRYFYHLIRFLNEKISKSEFDKSCYGILGRENLPLHNKLMLSILKNACQAKTPPSITIHDTGPAKSVVQTVKTSPAGEDGLEQPGFLVPNQNQNVAIWSNGVLPVSPRKVRSGIRDRKHRDRPSPLGPNGKVESIYNQSLGTDNTNNKDNMENGATTPCDYQRPLHPRQVVAEQPEYDSEVSGLRPAEKPRIPCKDQVEIAFVDDGKEVEEANRLNFSRTPLLAPLGIPLYPPSTSGSRTAHVSTAGEYINCYDSYGLSDTETLRKRMEQIAAAQGLGGVSMECANVLNNVLDVYLKKLIKSCAEMAGARCQPDPIQYPVNKQQIRGKIINGMRPSNHLHMQSSSLPTDIIQDKKLQCSVSLHDFKVAMELNPQQLGEDWSLLLEKVSLRLFDE